MNKKNQVLEGIEIVDIADQGKGVAKVDGLVCFVSHAIPGDKVDAQVIKKKKSFLEARLLNIQTPSEDRVEPFCSHFGVCGGCKWQHMDYKAQLRFKHSHVYNALSRIAHLDIEGCMEPILPSKNTQYYRNKLEYTFSNKRWFVDKPVEGKQDASSNALGFHVPGRFDKIIGIEHCYLQRDPSNSIRNGVYEYAEKAGISFYDLRRHEGALRNLIIRTSSTGEIMVVVVFAYPEENQIDLLMGYVQENFPEITSLQYVINQKKNDTIFDQEVHVYHGQDCIYEQMEGLRFKISVKSFYQTNSEQAYELYKIVREFAGLKGDELVFDLYTGAGTIAQFVAREAKHVVGIEYVESAIEDAKENAKLNGITNAEFFSGDMKDVLTAEFVEEHGKPDVIITDPPRAGMHPMVVERILEIASPKVVYVSCNPSTQARDLEVLSSLYEVERVKPVDMFPHTQHIENVVLLKLKK